MRDRFILIMALIFGYSAQAQYNNDWIQYDQTYLKFAYNRSGIFRLYKKDLEKLPEAINSPNRIQIFHRGKEILVYTVGLEDNRFEENDYLEFYLKKNQGEQDEELYYPKGSRPQVISNVISDISYIFVTVGKNHGKRKSTINYQPVNNKEDFHLANEIEHLQEQWSFNNITGQYPVLQQSYYERGESWTGAQINTGSPQSKIFQLKDYTPREGYDIHFSALINTRDRLNHDIFLTVQGKTIGNFKQNSYNHSSFSTELKNNELSNGNRFTFSSYSSQATDRYSWTQFTLRYPQIINLQNRDTLTINLPNQIARASNIILQNSPSELISYNISDPFQAEKLPYDQSQIYVPQRNLVKRIFVSKKWESFSAGQLIRFDKPTTTSNYIIITHSTLKSSAEAYKAFRESSEGGNYKVEIVEINDLYNQFNFGERSPLAIKNYLTYQLQNNKPGERFLLLIGKPFTFPDFIKEEEKQDLVPSFGYPGSDILLSSGIGGSSIDLSAYLTGRIPAKENREVLQYLEKVKEYEKNNLNQEWKKKALHLNGGNSITEIQSFRTLMQKLASQAEKSQTNLQISSLSKQTTEGVENININKYLNEGLGTISYFGHGAATVLDFNIGYASDNTLGYQNKGMYPFMYFNGCGIGNIFYTYNSLSSDWLFTPNRGSIGILANSFLAYTTNSEAFLKIFYEKLYNNTETLGKSIAFVIQEAIKQQLQSNNYNAYDQSNSQQMLLQGDPAVVVNPFQKPDYTWKKNSVQISSTNAGSSLGNSSQIVVSAEIQNLGKIEENQAIPVKAVVQYLNGTSESIGLRKITRSFENSYSDTLHVTQPIRKITLILNPDSNIPELTFENNIENIEVDWDQAKNVSIYPYRPELDKTNPTLLAFINDQLTTEGKYTKAPKITFQIQDENPLPIQIAGIRIYIKTNNQFTEIPRGLYTLTQNSANQITGTFVSPEQIGNYELLINATDAAGNLAGQDLYLKWEIVENLTPSIIVAPNPVQERIKLLINSVGQDQVALQLYDLKGKEVFKSTFLVNDGLNTIYLDFSPKQGTYTYGGTLNLKKITGKIIVE